MPVRCAPSRRNFAIDSSGFGSSRYERWYDRNTASPGNKCVWVKTHIACGVKDERRDGGSHSGQGRGDSPQFVPLVKETRGISRLAK